MKKLLPFISVACAAAVMGSGCLFIGSLRPKTVSTDPRKPVVLRGDLESTDDDFIETSSTPTMSKEEAEQNFDAIKTGTVLFGQKTIPGVLKNAGTGNVVFSPISMYESASILVGVSKGETQQQLIDLLSTPDVDTQQKGAETLIMMYSQNTDTTTQLANSLWIDQKFEPNKDTLTQISKDYNALIYTGDTSAQKAQDMLTTWVNQKSFGMLDPSSLVLSPDYLMVASLIYSRLSWEEPFDEDDTKEETFHRKDRDISVPMMHQSYSNTDVYYGDVFTEYSVGMGCGCLNIILPDEGKTTDDVLESDDFKTFLDDPDKLTHYQATVNLTIPKFSVNFDTSLSSLFQKLGVTEIFDPTKADFSPVLDQSGAFVGDISNITKFELNETGVVAASETADMLNIGARPQAPPKVVDFTVDRPFVFILDGYGTVPMFAGVITNPSGKT